MIRRQTAQQMFETSVTHMIRQGHMAMIGAVDHSLEECRYRMPNGDKCAIGCLITNKEYKPAMEGRNVGDLLLNFGNVLPLQFGTHRYLLEDLQSLHDNDMEFGINPEFMHRVKGIADAWELSTDFLETTEMQSLIAVRKIEAYNAKRRAVRAYERKRKATRARTDVS